LKKIRLKGIKKRGFKYEGRFRLGREIYIDYYWGYQCPLSLSTLSDPNWIYEDNP
jgi:hypothetical protein